MMDAQSKHFLQETCHADAKALQKLETYAGLIVQWQKAINLVSPTTLPQLWQRHLIDSAQLFPFIGAEKRVVDLGSGAGLPALVLAILGVAHVTSIESDTRKCVFQREVSRETSLTNITVLNQRLEGVTDIKAPVITARALAPLTQLVTWALPLVEVGGVMLFPKGENYNEEIAALRETPLMERVSTIDVLPSITDPRARIVRISLC